MEAIKARIKTNKEVIVTSFRDAHVTFLPSAFTSL